MNLVGEDVLLRRVLRVSVAYVVLSRVLLAMLMTSKRGLDFWNLVFTICWGLPPYVVLLLLARRIGVTAVLVSALVLVALSEALCWLDALNPTSSTAGLGVFLQPLYATAIVIPAALFLGWIIRRGSRSGFGGK